jgi:2-methylcitrate dehydratase PrpD
VKQQAGVTRELASFAVRTGYDDLPEDLVELVKLSSLNILGCCLGGYRTRLGQVHTALARELGGGSPQATIIGDGARVSAPAAAYANANLGFALDYEDMVRYIVHPGHTTVAAGLAVGEELHVSGKDYIAAVALGYEISSRIAVAVQPTAERGMQVWGEQYHPFASAVTAGQLLGLDEEQMDVAFGIAGTYSLVPSAYKYFGAVEETRPLREVKMGWGWMCLAGVMAALSARRGLRGGHGVLDGEYGFWIMHGSDQCDFARMLDGLGAEWLTRETEFKIHPSIGLNHPAYWATRQLVEEGGIAAEDIDRVRVTTLWADRVDDPAPAGEVDAQFSLPYTVAATIAGGTLGPDLYTEEKRSSSVMRHLLERIEVIPDAEADRAFFEGQRLLQSVEIALRDGRVLRREIEFPRDKPAVGRPEIERKFEELASASLDEGRRREVRQALNRLEQLEDVTELVRLLQPAG